MQYSVLSPSAPVSLFPVVFTNEQSSFSSNSTFQFSKSIYDITYISLSKTTKPSLRGPFYEDCQVSVLHAIKIKLLALGLNTSIKLTIKLKCISYSEIHE